MRAMSSLKTGVTTKFAPANIYCEAALASVTDPTPNIIPGNSLIEYLITSVKTSSAKSPLFVNSISLAPPS